MFVVGLNTYDSSVNIKTGVPLGLYFLYFIRLIQTHLQKNTDISQVPIDKNSDTITGKLLLFLRLFFFLKMCLNFVKIGPKSLEAPIPKQQKKSFWASNLLR